MISNPDCGWCDFEIGKFIGHPSYLTDVPVELMECFVSYFRVGYGMCWFDEEGSEFTLVITPYDTFIISQREEDELININEEPEKLAVELLADINKYRKEWIMWELGYEEYLDHEKVEKEKYIGELYDKLSGILKKRDILTDISW